MRTQKIHIGGALKEPLDAVAQLRKVLSFYQLYHSDLVLPMVQHSPLCQRAQIQ